MEAKELRIGNYVYEQSGKLVVNRDSIYKVENVNIQSAHKYEPIPITEEWLLKFSAIVSDGRFGKFYTINFIEFHTSESGEICFCWDGFMKEIKNVHQLQNLYFALTNEELTVKR